MPKKVTTKKPPESKSVGRPSKYSSVMLKKAEAYVDSCKDDYRLKQFKIGTKEVGTGRNKKKVDILHTEVIFDVKIPLVDSLAIELGVHRDTLYEWADKHPEFSDTLAKIKALQHQKLISGGLSGRYSQVITKLMLTTNHGYRDKVDTNANHNFRTLGDLMDELENLNNG